jgi:hypothetical protein
MSNSLSIPRGFRFEVPETVHERVVFHDNTNPYSFEKGEKGDKKTCDYLNESA